MSAASILFRHMLLIACFTLLAVSATNAQTIVQHNSIQCSGGNTGITSCALLLGQPQNVNVTAGNAIEVSVAWYTNTGQQATVTVSDNNGNTYFPAVSLTTPAALDDPGMAIFYSCNIASTPNPQPTITATISSPGGISLHATEIGNVALACFDAGAGQATLNEPAGMAFTFTSGLFTTAYANELIYGWGQAYPGYATPSTGFTSVESFGALSEEYENVSSAGSYNSSFAFTPVPGPAQGNGVALGAAFVGGPSTEPSLPCGKGNCEGQVGHPINLVNGNVWATQRDYYLPGLGGGLTLDRTWNSLWKNQRGSLPVAGMFGDSWRSTYEERLVSTGSNSINYYRSNGDGWSFQWNSTTQNYQLLNPTNERATLVFNGPASQYTITFSDGTKRVFNGSGYLTAILDRNSNQVSIAYDTSNRITTATDAASRTVTFAYANASFPALATSATDAVGNIANYSYDASGRLSNVTYPDASQLNFAYDSNNLLDTITDAQSKVIESHTYDSSRRGLTSQRANGVDAVTITYPSSGTTTVQDSLGNTTTVNYNTGISKFITSVTGPTCSTCLAGNTSSFAYDANGNRTSSTDANGNVTTYTYDATGNVLTRSTVVNGNTLTWTFTYNTLNEVLTAKDPLNNTTTNTYDAAGNLLTTTTPSPDGVKPGSTTTFTYDTKGELQTITDPLNNKITIAYFPTGLIQTMTDPQTNATNYTYDGRGNRLTAKDALNNATSFAYDAMNRVTKITYPNTTTTQFTYDTRGRRITTTDQNNEVTTYGYDDADRLTSVKDAANNITTYGYDTESNLTSIQDANNHTTTFHYNTNRWVDRTTFPSGLPETYGYDLNGNLTSKTDRKNQQITYTYDQLNRLTKKTYPDNSTVNYTYDNDSRLTQVTDPTGTYQFGFDNMGRLTSTTTNYSFLTSRSFTTSYGYDAASNRTGFTDPENGVTGYAYDTLNRLQTLTPPSAFGSGSFSFGYDADSRRTSVTRPNSVNTTYGYDALSRLLSVTHKQGTSTLDGATYTVDNAGNRTSRTPLPSGKATNFTYDAIYELLTATQGKTTTESYTYDAVGNRLTSSGTSYTNNSSNELTAVGSNTTYTFDNNGNTLTKVVSGHGGGTTTYAWDIENRLTSVTLPGSGGTVSFKYDPFGRRIYKSSSSGTSVYAYDGDNLVEETNSSGAVVARYEDTQNIDEPLAMLRSGATSYFHADGLGSVTSLTNANGSIANTYTYDSFGNLTNSTGSLVNPFRYTARESDTETGLYYYRARYYDQQVGRFMSEDPARYDDNQNFYRYGLNNPIIYLDPSGLFVEILCEPITQWGLGHWRRAKHCRVHVKCDSMDKTFELEGPRPGSRHGNPRADNFDPSRPANPRIPVKPPKDNCSSGSPCGFENCIAKQFNFYFTNQQALPNYGAINSNSNQFAKDLITSCGGNVNFPFWGGFYGEVH